MCGICGKLMFDSAATVDVALMRTMADSIRHRGPDDQGYYVSGPVGLAFRRLSIIDLSTGHQPISNEDASVWVIFNGEIYNHRELRESLIARGHVFRTKTDTEVLVHLYEDYGPSFVEKLRGMFAFAIWDTKTRTLILARDRVGIKPLYYRIARDCISFGSEIKAILADPDTRRELDATAINRFMTFYYLPGEQTLFRDISKLRPGSYLIAKNGRIEIHDYWDLKFEQADIDLESAERQFTELLDKSVDLHMISDVPVGFLLSGGLDSTAMLSFASGKTDRPLSSYTVGFAASGVADERPYARLAAERFGTDHHELTITPKQFSDFLPRYIWHMEEPVCEPPAVALYYVSELASKYVKVLISGEGGDEAFAGYSNYRNLVWLERLKRGLGPLQGLLQSCLLAVSSRARWKRVEKYARLLNLPLESYYFSRTSSPFHPFNSGVHQLYSDDFAKIMNKQIALAPVQRCFEVAAEYGTLEKMLYVDTKTWLPDDLLVKADKMTMANSVELRVPFLDHEVLEFAASLPASFKLHWFSTKYLAKRALSARVPQQILTRRKAGFPVPYETWLRGELKEWVYDILLDATTQNRGYFKKGSIQHIIEQDERYGGFSKEIFSLLILELWHRTFECGSSRESVCTPLRA